MSYRFAPLPREVHRERRPHNRHDWRLPDALFGRIELSYRCTQPVHVGSGFKTLDGGSVVRSMVRSGAALAVPGASMKGLLRARYETLTRSCALFGLAGVKRPAKVRSRSRSDVGLARLDRGAAAHAVLRPCRPRDEPCAACALFGRMSSRSRIAVGDFLPEDRSAKTVAHLPPQYEPRLHHLGQAHVDERAKTFVVTTLHGRKYYGGGHAAPPAPMNQAVEVLPIGTVIVGTLRLFNVTAAEMGGLMAAAGLLPSSLLKIGAGKSEGFGQINPTSVRWHLHDAGGRPTPHAPPSWRQAFCETPDYWPGGEAALVEFHGPRST